MSDNGQKQRIPLALDRAVAIAALLTLTGYLGIFVFSVPRPALFIVAGFVLLLVYRDFWSQLFRRR